MYFIKFNGRKYFRIHNFGAFGAGVNVMIFKKSAKSIAVLAKKHC
jgi:hypothetical protein